MDAVDGVLDGLERIYADGQLEAFAEAMTEERKRFSWEAMCDRIEELYSAL